MKENKTKFAADTSSRSAKDWIKALLILLLGLTIAHFGVTLFSAFRIGYGYVYCIYPGAVQGVRLNRRHRSRDRFMHPYGGYAFDDKRVRKTGNCGMRILRRPDH